MPEYQGFFLRDMQSGTTTVIARTGDMVDGRTIEDFVYWNFSGRVPGKGHEGGDDPEETLDGPLAFDVVRRGFRQRRARHVGDQGASQTTTMARERAGAPAA